MWATADAETTGEIYETVPEPYVSRVDEIRWNRKKKKKKSGWTISKHVYSIVIYELTSISSEATRNKL